MKISGHSKEKAVLFFLLLIGKLSEGLAVQTSEPVSWSGISSNRTGIEAHLEINSTSLLDNPQNYDLNNINSLSDISSLAQLAAWVAVPNGTGLNAAIRIGNSSEATEIYMPDRVDQQPYVEVGEPALFRGVRIFPIKIVPFAFDESGRLSISKDIVLTAEFDGVDNRSAGRTGQIRISSDMRRILDSHILNTDELDELDFVEVAPLGRILIVADEDENVRNALAGYISWKIQQGYTVEIESPANTASSTSIMQLVRNRYNDEEAVPLDHLLLIGDSGNAIQSPFRMVHHSEYGDYGYSLLDGNDILADISVGRFSVRDLTTLLRVVNKTIAYERDVEVDDTRWLENVVLTAGSGSGISTIYTNRTIKWMFTENDISSDTLWYTMEGNIPNFIVNSVNNGACFVNYRGYLGMSGWTNNHINNFTNSTRLPVFTLITCGTGNFTYEATSKSEGIFRAGTGINNFRGGVACIGTSTAGTHTRFNNVIDAAFYEGVLHQNIRSIGWALVHAKIRLYEAYIGTNDQVHIDDFSHWNNLMGDPALRIWAGVPLQPVVIHDVEFGSGQNHLDVEIDVAGDLPEYSWATLTLDDEIIDSRRFNEFGYTRLLIAEPSEYDSLMLTVVGDNIIPYQMVIRKSTDNIFVGFVSVGIDDGDEGNGQANPGEMLTLELTVSNSGTDSSTQYNAIITSEDSRLICHHIDELIVPALAPGGQHTLMDDIQVRVASRVQDGAVPSLTLTIVGREDFVSAVPIPVTAWSFIASGEPVVMNEENKIMPGETEDFYLGVENTGSIAAVALSAVLRSTSESITIIDSIASFDDIEPGNISDNEDDPFQISVNELASIGEIIPLVLIIENESGATDSIQYFLFIADPQGNGPIGPDEYGYWALDDEDSDSIYSTVPTYAWTEISIIGELLVIEDIADEDDDAAVINLPFTFRYYGKDYRQATICSNGWMCFGAHPSIPLFRNWPIPNPNGPPAMIAPFWDDLRTTGGGIYTYNDVAGGRLIVQWNCRTAHNNVNEDFQLILFDPAVWQTNTGNGKILFQYQTISYRSNDISDNDYATIGIECPDQSRGLQYAYWNSESEGAAPLENGRAILFTDDLGLMSNPPQASISPERMNFIVVGGGTESDSILIANETGGALTWTALVIDGELDQTERNRRTGLRTSRKSIKSIAKSGAELDDRGLGTMRPGVTAQPKKQINWEVKEQKGDEGLPGPQELDNWGGPDNFGYIWRDSNEINSTPFQWHEREGEEITGFRPDGDDGFAGPYDFPFDFEYYGSGYSLFWICTNGYITLAPEQDALWRNRALPTNLASRGIIAPWWDDLDLTEEGDGQISLWSNNNDSVVVTYSEVRGWGGRGGPYTFQIIFNESGAIIFQYLDMNIPNDDRLDESTIGIQDYDRDIGLTILHNSANYIENELAIKVSVPSVWLSLSSSAGIIPGGGNSGTLVTVSGENIPFGEYEGSILIRTNDTSLQSKEIPVSLAVIEDGTGPFVGNIPDQTIIVGNSFEYFRLDDYSLDPNYPHNRLFWTWEGNDDLIVQIVNRFVMITPPDEEWTGSDTITFIATNPEDISDSDEVIFTIINENTAPSPFRLLSPENGDSVEGDVVNFEWETSNDPDGMVYYSINIATNGDTARFDELLMNDFSVCIDTIGFDLEYQQVCTWWVVAMDEAGAQTSSDVSQFYLSYSDAGESLIMPVEYSVSEPWPNPFNPSVSIEVALPQKAAISLKVLDLLGREVANINYGTRSPGYHQLNWQDRTAASGIYFFIVEAGAIKETRKALLIK